MYRLYIWRFICLLAIIGGILQSIGFFLPYGLLVNTATGATLKTDSYWSTLTQLLSGEKGISAAFSWVFVLIALVIILVPFITACMEFFRRPQRWSSLTCISISMGIAVLGLLQIPFLIFDIAMNSFCVGGDCVLGGDFGSGMLPLCVGSLLSLACFITLFILWLVWWHRSVPQKMVRYPSHQSKFSDYSQAIRRH